MQGRAVTLLLLLVLAPVCGCERQTQYSILTTLFTGVPPMEELYGEGVVKEVITEEKATDKSKLFRFQHPLWAARNCAACHTADVRMPLVLVEPADNLSDNDSNEIPVADLNLPLDKLCVNCHRDKTARRAIRDRLWLHQPVAQGNCLACHTPHESSHQNLLRSSPETICITCHKPEQLQKQCDGEITAKMRTKGCLDCHTSHMGKNRKLLSQEYQEVKILAASAPLSPPAATASPPK